MKAYKAFLGGYHQPLQPEDVPDHVQSLKLLDNEDNERTRRRVEYIVKDKKTAEALKAWYHSLCERPRWRDDYLSYSTY